MAINPWGEVIALADHDEPAVVLASLDLDEVGKARAAIPALANERSFAGPFVATDPASARSAAE